VLLVVRGFHIALRARTGFEMLLAAGLTAVIGLQALIILAGSMQVIPLTGITLPFVSYGGSSVLTNFLIVGLLLRISNEHA
jgi:cell division protein FtsW (lipid II flippase)